MIQEALQVLQFCIQKGPVIIYEEGVYKTGVEEGGSSRKMGFGKSFSLA